MCFSYFLQITSNDHTGFAFLTTSRPVGRVILDFKQSVASVPRKLIRIPLNQALISYENQKLCVMKKVYGWRRSIQERDKILQQGNVHF